MNDSMDNGPPIELHTITGGIDLESSIDMPLIELHTLLGGIEDLESSIGMPSIDLKALADGGSIDQTTLLPGYTLPSIGNGPANARRTAAMLPPARRLASVGPATSTSIATAATATATVATATSARSVAASTSTSMAGNRPSTSLTTGGDAASAAAYLPVGTRINGRYEVLSTLGEGGMGVVYRVRDEPHPERPLALKTIRHRVATPTHLAMFKAEFRVLAELRHPGLAGVYDFEPLQGSDEYFFTLDYVRGDTIQNATKGLPVRRVIELVVELCRALAYVHRRNIIHFDLKPANILVDAAGGLKLLDFGLVGAQSRLSKGSVFGTPPYMAPEIFAGTEIDHRADLYSLGILLFQLVCRRRAFPGNTMAELARAHLHLPITFFARDEAVPTWVRNVILRLCAKKPGERPRSANAVIELINREGGLAFEIETSETRESYLFSSRFVGRDAELGRTLEFVGARLEGPDVATAPVMFLAGPSGSGKSRLVAQVRQQVQLQRTAFIEASCYESGGHEYAPISDLLRHLVRLADVFGGAALVERFGPDLVKLSPQLGLEKGISPGPRLADPDRERVQLHDRVADFLISLAEIKHFVLYVNDLQWARPGTAEVLDALLMAISVREQRLQRRVRLAVLGSFRDDEVADRPIARTLGRGLGQVITLGPFDEATVHEVLASMLGVASLPAPFVTRVAAETAGNVFFIEEVLRVLVESGAVYINGDEWAARDEIGKLAIPRSIAGALERRISLLLPAARDLVSLLAVVARPVELRLMREVLGLGEDALIDLLRDLERRQLVVLVDGGPEAIAYRLIHDRLRETQYAALAREACLGWHARVATALEQRGTDDDVTCYELARHWAKAEVRDKALRYGLEGGTRALSDAAGTAIDIFEGVRPFVDDPAELHRIEVQLAELYVRVARFDDADAMLTRLLEVTTQSAPRAGLLRNLALLRMQRGDCARALDPMWESIELLGGSRVGRAKPAVFFGIMRGALLAFLRPERLIPSGPIGPEEAQRRRALASAYLTTGWLYYFLFPPGMMLVQLRALRLTRPLGDSPELAVAQAQIGCGLGGAMGMHALAKTFAERGLEMARRVGSPWHLANAAGQAGQAAMCRGDFAEAITLLTEARQAFRRLGDVSELALPSVGIIRTLQLQGRHREAYARSLEEFEFFERRGDVGGRMFLEVAGSSAAMIGETDRGYAQLAEGIERSCQAGNYLCGCIGTICGAEARQMNGDDEGALADVAIARQIKRDHGVDWESVDFIDFIDVRSRLRLAEKLTDAGERARAVGATRGVLARCVSLAEKKRPPFAPWAALSTATFERLSGRSERALHSYERAHEIAERMGAIYALAEIQAECARTGMRIFGRSRLALARSALVLYRETGVRYGEQQGAALVASLEGSEPDEALGEVRDGGAVSVASVPRRRPFAWAGLAVAIAAVCVAFGVTRGARGVTAGSLGAGVLPLAIAASAEAVSPVVARPHTAVVAAVTAVEETAPAPAAPEIVPVAAVPQAPPPMPASRVESASPSAPQAENAANRHEEDLLVVRFETDSAALTGQSAADLAAGSARLGQCTGHLRITGHASRGGSAEHNRSLALQRAMVVRAALVSAGLTTRTTIRSVGDTRPETSDTTVDGRARNQRVRVTCE